MRKGSLDALDGSKTQAHVGCLGMLYANSILNKNTKTFKYIYTNHSNPTKLVYLHFEVRSK